jgi:hypothetical protein
MFFMIYMFLLGADHEMEKSHDKPVGCRPDRTTGDRLPKGPRGAGQRHRPGAVSGNRGADRLA